jgi:hypothetical protein
MRLQKLIAKFFLIFTLSMAVLYCIFMLAFYALYGIPKTVEYNVDRHRDFIGDITNRIYFLERLGEVVTAKTSASAVTVEKGVFANRPSKPHCNFDMKARPLKEGLHFSPVRPSGPIIKSRSQWQKYFSEVEEFEYWLIYLGPAIDFKTFLTTLPDKKLTSSDAYFSELWGDLKLRREKISRDLTEDHAKFIFKKSIA